MGNYTVLEDSAADAAVQEVLDLVVEKTLSLLGEHLHAIVLVGGFGRGEGGVFKVNDEYQLVNDLDLLTFVNGDLGRAKARFGEPLEQLSHRLLKDGRGLKEIDLDLTHVKRYQFLVSKTVGNYEIAMGNKVLYGDLDLIKVMPEIDPRRLSLYEGANYFRNRGSGLLIPAIYFLTDGLQNIEKKKNFQIELQKACQAMGDAFLLMAIKYNFSYRERLRCFKQLDSQTLEIPATLFKKVSHLYEWGVKKKLVPSFEWPGDQEMIDRWFEIQTVFSEFFLWFESERLHKKFSGWGEYSDYINQHGADEPSDIRLRSALGSILSTLTGKVDGIPRIQRHRRCLSMMPLLLFSLFPDMSVDTSLISKIVQLTGQSTAVSDLASWKSATENFLISYYPTRVVLSALSGQLGVD